jgi:glycosidase
MKQGSTRTYFLFNFTRNVSYSSIKKDGTVIAVGDNTDGQCEVSDWSDKHPQNLSEGVYIVFNHCGSGFFTFRDVLKYGEASKYKDWFYQLRFLTKCYGDVKRLRLAFLFMFTFVGIPSIFYGDEKGISGKEEHEYRRPMLWEDTPESLKLFNEFKERITFRKQHKALTSGDFRQLIFLGWKVKIPT